MKKAPSLLALAFLIIACSSCAGGDVSPARTAPPAPQPEYVDIRDFSWDRLVADMSRSLENPTSCDVCKEIRGVYIVTSDMHYGYSLHKLEDGYMSTENSIVPILNDDRVKAAFSRFFSNENMNRIFGQSGRIGEPAKRTYCDCAGYGIERNGVTFFRVLEANLYAK